MDEITKTLAAALPEQESPSSLAPTATFSRLDAYDWRAAVDSLELLSADEKEALKNSIFEAARRDDELAAYLAPDFIRNEIMLQTVRRFEAGIAAYEGALDAAARGIEDAAESGVQTGIKKGVSIAISAAKEQLQAAAKSAAQNAAQQVVKTAATAAKKRVETEVKTVQKTQISAAVIASLAAAAGVALGMVILLFLQKMF